MPNCLNCNNPLSTTQKFCSECGQKTSLKRANLHDVLHDMIHYFTHADKGIFQLLKSLILQPGQVAKEYIEGKRKKHFPPLNFFLIVAAIYLLMNGLAVKNQRIISQQQYQPTKELKTSQSSKQLADTENFEKVGKFYAKYANYVAMLAAPLITIFIWLIYWKGQYNFTEHLIANLYLIGFTNLFRSLIIVPATIIFSISVNAKEVYLFFLLFEITYRSLFYYRFMGQYNSVGKLKAVGVSILTTLFWLIVTSSFVFLYILYSNN